MKKKYLWSILAFAVFSWGHSQQNAWKSSSDREVSRIEKMDRVALPTDYQVFNIDLNKLKNSLEKAPNFKTQSNSTVIVSFPNSEGELVSYEIFDAPIMERGLAEKFPNIKSYLGKGAKDRNASIRFSITPFGLHAIQYDPKNGTSYIDTYTKDLKNYIVYNRENIDQKNPINCLTDNTEIEQIYNETTSALNKTVLNSQGKYREYRLAMACTVEYAAFHLAAAQAAGIPTSNEQQKKAAILAAMATTMTRVNFIFERDHAIHMNLIDNNDKLIFIDSDNFNNVDANILIEQSQTVINKIIGAPNYDIGHTVSTGAGGLAGVNVPCDNSRKAMGVTGSSAPVGDPYDVDFVAHEMGHQFGAFHTFNSSCANNRSNTTSVEPGSGNTIMAYAGVCPPDQGEGNINVRLKSDPFFHSISVEQIGKFISTAGNCSVNTSNNNPAPVVNAGIDKVIPKSTPFYLDGSATDSNNQSSLTYSWEQTDIEISTQPPLANATKGPNFMYMSPTTSTRRYFPNFKDVLLGFSPKWEVLPSVERHLNFRFFVRDNNPTLGGQTNFDDVKVKIQNTGPFIITYPNSGNEQWQAGTSQTVQWNVAGTTANGINTSHVNIKFSDDNGLNFITLVENTPNDGQEEVIVPGFNTIQARILIEPVGNIYYAVSKRFSVVGGTASIDDNALDSFKLYPNPTYDNFTVEFNTNNSKEISIEIHDLRGRLIQTEAFTPVSSSFRTELSVGNLQAGIYLVTIKDGKNKLVKKIIKK